MRLELKDITKTFPGVLANDRISISADRGEILGLLGENGAGKSTLMNILSGLYRPDSGEILIDGSPRTFSDPRKAIDAGIGMVHQHFQLVPVFDVVEAVALGAESTSGVLGRFDRKTARQRVVELSATYNLNVNPDAKIEDLPVGVRQRVEILKALYRKSDILVLDEPSAVLTPFETLELFGIIRGLAEAGTTVIFITHKLNEVLEVADKITVLRRGRVAGTVDPKTATREQLANLMVGRDVELRVPKDPATPGDVVLQIRNLHVRDDRGHMAVQDVNLEVRAGEIVALAGVQGNGQTELVEAIVGLRQVDSGEINLDAHSIKHVSPRHISDEGVAHIPEDR
ncbi:MAG TPA: ATP-binding cassette domain-containing protein, partial [Candidatus Limnocylindrales bacterium]|nr:ATP-binding cassette domain-containing protein [Candidatus Limnocylindrales bacterium]